MNPALFDDFADYPVALSWSATGNQLAVGGESGTVAVYDVNSGRRIAEWSAHGTGLHCVSWHPTELVLTTAGQDGHARIWSVDDTAALERELSANTAWIEHLAWRPDGRQLALAAGRKVTVFSRTGTPSTVIDFPRSTVAAIEWRPLGTQLAIAGYGDVEIHNATDGKRTDRLPFKGSINALRWSPDGQVVAAGSQDGTVHFWRLRARSDAMMSGFDGKPKQLDWSANSRWLATGGGATVTVWPFDKRGPEGRTPTQLEFHKEPVTALAFAPRGLWIATGCRDARVCVWQLDSPQGPRHGTRLEGRVEQLAWSPDPRQLRLAAISSSGRVGVWNVAA